MSVNAGVNMQRPPTLKGKVYWAENNRVQQKRGQQTPEKKYLFRKCSQAQWKTNILWLVTLKTSSVVSGTADISTILASKF